MLKPGVLCCAVCLLNAVGCLSSSPLCCPFCNCVAYAGTPAHPVLPAAPGVNGGPLGVFMQQPVQQQQQQQQPVQQQQQAPAQPLSGLQALLGNPAMLSAAILGGAAAGSSTGASGAAAVQGTSVGGDDLFAGGSIFGGFQQLPATFSAALGQSDAGYADEGDDPYDPTLEG